MNRARRPARQHPLAPVFNRAVDYFSVALSSRHHSSLSRDALANFLSYLGADHPEVNRLEQLRREPHILGWMSACARKRRPCRPRPTSTGSSLCAPSSTNWLGRKSLLNSFA